MVNAAVIVVAIAVTAAFFSLALHRIEEGNYMCMYVVLFRQWFLSSLRVAMYMYMYKVHNFITSPTVSVQCMYTCIYIQGVMQTHSFRIICEHEYRSTG